MTDTEDTTRKIKKVMKELTELLVLKNEQYGDSALNTGGIFANGSAEELMRVLMDDKISRLAMGHDAIAKDEDIFLDLAGYWVLWVVGTRKRDGLWE